MTPDAKLLREALDRIVAEYDEDRTRPPSSVSMGMARAALSAPVAAGEGLHVWPAPTKQTVTELASAIALVREGHSENFWNGAPAQLDDARAILAALAAPPQEGDRG